MMTERIMEDAISNNPEKYLGEPDLKFISRQFRIGNYIFDLIFEDRHGAKLIVELQKGTLDRNHTYKILDYYYEYKDKNPKEFIELMVIANSIPQERKKRLLDWGISFKEIPETEFLKESITIIQETKEADEHFSKSTIGELKPEISSNSIAIFKKEKFKKLFDKCNKDIQELFLFILKEIDSFNAKKYSTNKPDYRLQKNNVFCEILLHPSKGLIQINLRVDSNSIYSSIINIEEIKDQRKPGKTWLKFYVNHNTPKLEIMRLIKEVYEFSD